VPQSMGKLLAISGLIILSPLMAVIGAVIKLQDGGPIIFRQKRVGRSGEQFEIRKFRTMTESGMDGPSVTASGDDRITPVGATLRTTKCDEIPQLWNVLRGEMALVGPRPEVPKYVALWTERQQKVILSVLPGITDPVSVSHRSEETTLSAHSDPEAYYRETLLPQKAEGYVQYVENRSIGSDVAILFKTIKAVLRR
jgi:lipopolysaccharide/colanic/teichoic acid biosynthesis glycosyltransferase